MQDEVQNMRSAETSSNKTDSEIFMGGTFHHSSGYVSYIKMKG